MEDGLLAYSTAKMQENGILLSGDAEGGKYGIMTRANWQSFFNNMVEAGTLPAGLNWEDAFDLRFVQVMYGLRDTD